MPMDSFYVAVILLLLGVIVGGSMVVRWQGTPAQMQYPPHYPLPLVAQRRFNRRADSQQTGWWVLLIFGLIVLGLSQWKKVVPPLSSTSVQKAMLPSSHSFDQNDLDKRNLRSAPPPESVVKPGWYIQMGAYRDRLSAENVLQHWQKQSGLEGKLIPADKETGVYKVYLGAFEQKRVAQQMVEKWGQGWVVAGD